MSASQKSHLRTQKVIDEKLSVLQAVHSSQRVYSENHTRDTEKSPEKQVQAKAVKSHENRQVKKSGLKNIGDKKNANFRTNLDGKKYYSGSRVK